MTDAERQLAEDRENRVAARALFDRRITQVRSDLSARGIGGRIKDSAVNAGEEAIAQGIEIARENKGVIAATATALALWFLRNPIIALIRRLAGPKQAQVHDGADNRQPDD